MADRSAEQLLSHAGWLRALALRLVRDHDVADDLVQETWVATIDRPPAGSARSWLAKVMVNRLRMRARGDGRRIAREQAALLVEDREVPSAETLVARADLQRKLVELVLRLDEPYRTTVLLHYSEGVPLASIARSQNLPASTVRWHLATALDQLRDWLDAETGDRKQWAVPLLAFSKGAAVAHKTSKLVGVVILFLLIAGVVWLLRGRDDDARDDAALATSNPANPTQRGDSTTTASVDPARLGWAIQPGIAPRRIAGRVTFDGAPVGGAIVELASLATESGLGTTVRRVTSATGEFDFGPQPAMEHSVRASAPRHASAVLDLDLRNPLVRADHLELALGGCTAAMYGTVRDASGGVIEKARLARLDPDNQRTIPGGPAVIADENGEYELCLETRWPPYASVEVSAVGYGTIIYTGMVPGRVKTDFALVPEATIVGRVIRDDTRQPIAEAYVFVPTSGQGTQRTAGRATITDASGRFRIDRLAPGTHLVFARADGAADSVRGVPVVLAAGQTSTEIEIRLEAGSTIRGTVVDGDKPVAGARVATGNRSAYSQDDGSYVLTGVPRGDASFTALPYDVIKPKTFTVTQSSHDGVTLDVEPLGTITGLVMRGQRAVPSAAVYLRGPNDRDLDPVFTGADGRFIARGLRAGPWSVAAGSQQLGAFGPAPQIVQLARGQTTDVTIDMVYAASISGRVIDQTGAPVPGVTVGFIHTSADDVGLTMTAPDGSFRAATMTGGGQYRPKVSASPNATWMKTTLAPASGTEFPLVTLADGNAEVTGIVLAVKLERLTISGTVVDSDGAPVPDARIVAELVEGNAEPRFFPGGAQGPTDTADVNGHFEIGDLLDGTYALRALSAAGLDGTLLGVRAGRTDATLVLPSPGGIDVTLAGFKTPPQVTALPSSAHWASAPLIATLQGNLASLRNLAPGSYLVTARTTTEGASELVEVTAKRTARIALTSKGSAVVAGRVHELRSNKLIEGMTCRALPRIGVTQPMSAPGGVRTDAQGAFTLDAPTGDIVVWCDGLWSLYSDGMRMVTLPPAQRIDLDVPVVGLSGGPSGATLASSMGADLDYRVIVPTFVGVKPGGPAAAAGFANGDVMTAVDGASVAELSPRGVWVLILNRSPGTSVKVTATRAGKPINGAMALVPAQ